MSVTGEFQRAPSQAPGDVDLPSNSYGYVAVETKSGLTRCQIDANQVICETSATTWPAHGVVISADGHVEFKDGNLGDIGPVGLDYRTYHALGWTIAASDSGTRFTKDSTGHGAVVSVESAQRF